MKWLLLSLVTSFGAAALYFGLSIGLGIQQRIPFLALLLMVLAIVLACWAPWKGATVVKAGFVLVECALLALFAWWTLSYSSYREDPDAAKKGTSLVAALGAGGSLIDSSGQPFNLGKAAAETRGLLLVFYRGHW